MSIVNHNPVVSHPIVDQVVRQGVPFSYQFAENSFYDEDPGTTLTYTAQTIYGEPLPAWISFDPATRTFTGTSSVSNVGFVHLQVIASDGAASVNSPFLVTTLNENPVVSHPLIHQDWVAGGSFTYQFSEDAFSDADVGSVLTYTAYTIYGEPLPSWIHFDPSTRTFSGNPTAAEVGFVHLQVVATDGIASVNNPFLVTVAANTPGPVPTPEPKIGRAHV